MNGLTGHLTPRAVSAVAVSMLALWSAAYFAAAGGNLTSLVPGRVVEVVSALMAYGIAMWLCVEIAAEYRSSRDLRIAWVLLGVCAGISMVRHLFDTPLMDLLWPGYWTGPWSHLMRELLAAAALMLLAAGILTMAEAFRRMRLGFAVRRADYALIAGVAVLFVLIVYFRDDLSAARASVPLARRAQLLSQFIFAVAAAGCVLLMRIGKQMGGGKLAVAMGWITAHIVLRAALVLSNTLQAHLHRSWPLTGFISPFLLNAAIWMFAMAAASRYQVRVTAVRQAARLGVVANSRLTDALDAAG